MRLFQSSILSCLISILFFASHAVSASSPYSKDAKEETTKSMAAFTSTQSGAWNDPLTWGGAVGDPIPASGDVVTISAGDVVTTAITMNFDALTIDGTLSSVNTTTTLTGNSITNNGTLTLDHAGGGVSTFLLESDMTNDGTITWQGSNVRFTTTTAATLTNNGTFNSGSAANGNNHNINVINTATGVVTHTSPAQNILGDWTNEAGGQINVDAGVMILLDSLANAGAIAVTGELRFTNASLNHTAGTIDGTGTLSFYGTTNISAPSGITLSVDNITNQGGAVVTGINSPAMTIDAGSTLTALNTSLTLAGFSNITNNGTVLLDHTIGGISALNLESDMTNDGTITWQGSNVRFTTTTGATLTNNGTFNSGSTGNGNNHNINVVNTATGVVTHTSPGQNILGEWTNEAGGQINVDSGVMIILDSLANAGTLAVTGELRFTNASLNHTAGTIDGAGTLSFYGTTNISAPSGITLSVDNITNQGGAVVTGINSPAMTIDAGTTLTALNTSLTLAGFSNITNNGTVVLDHTIGGISALNLESDMTNDGTITWQGSNVRFTTTTGATLTNNGTFNSGSTGNGNNHNINVVNTATGVVTHTSPGQNILGEWTNEAGGQINVDSGVMILLDSLANAGTLAVTGELRFTNASLNHTAGTIDGAGTLSFHGATNISAPSGITLSVATISPNSGASILGVGDPTLTIDAGSTYSAVNTTNTIDGFSEVVNNGTMSINHTAGGISNAAWKSDITNNGTFNWDGTVGVTGRADTTYLSNMLTGVINKTGTGSSTNFCVLDGGIINNTGTALACEDPLPYDYISNGTGGGNWNTLSTWLVNGVEPPVLPTTDDNVTIVSGDVVTTATTMNFDALTIDGTLSSVNTMTTLTGNSITNNGTLTLDHAGGGVSTFLLESDMTNDGTITWQGSNVRFTTTTGATLTNNGTFNSGSAANGNNHNINVINTATGVVTHTSPAQNILGEWTNEAGGQINVDAGVMIFLDSLANAGTLAVTGELRFTNASLNHTAGTIDGTGTLSFHGTTNISAPSGITLSVDNIFNQGGAVVSGINSPAMTIAAGSTWTASNASLTLAGFSNITNNGMLVLDHTAGGVSTFLLESDMTNDGTITWQGSNARFTTTTAATLTNNGTFNSGSAANGNNHNINVINTATGVVTHTSPAQNILGEWTNEAGGQINVDAGVMIFLDSLSNAGTLAVTGELRFTNASLNHTAGTIDGTGTLGFYGTTNISAPSGITLSVDIITNQGGAVVSGINSPAMTIAAGSTWTASNASLTLAGFSNITNNGTLILDHTAGGVSTFLLESDMTNDGTITWQGGNVRFTTTTAATLTNNGTFNSGSAANGNNHNINVINTATGVITHASLAQNILGEWTNEAGGQINVDSGVMIFLDSLANAGTLAVTGELRFTNASLNHTAGTIDGTGILSFQGVTNISAPSDITLSVATISPFGGASILGVGDPALTIDAGSTYSAVNATNTIDGFSEVVNNGTMSINHTAGGISNAAWKSDITNNGTFNWDGTVGVTGRADTTYLSNMLTGVINKTGTGSSTNFCVLDGGTLNNTGSALACVEIVCSVSLATVVPTDEVCPGASDGTITVTATCVSCTNGSADIEYSLDGTAWQASNVFSGLAPNSYTAQVRDVNDATCSETASTSVTVSTGTDSTDPVAVCPTTAPTVSLDANGNGTLAADALGDGNSTDNCGTPSETSSLTNYTCADIGTRTVVLTADDGNGNIDSANCSLTVQDAIDPLAVCPTTAPTVVLDSNGNGTLAADALAGSNSTDNCGTPTETSPLTNYTCADAPSQSVVLTVTDSAGNTKTTSCTVTIDDATCCDISISAVSATDEICPSANDGTITVTAACASCTNGATDIEYSIDGTNWQTSNAFTGVSPNTYTVSVRDASTPACTATDSGTVAAGSDTTDPVAICPTTAPVVSLDVTGNVTLVVNALAGGNSTDDCGIATETSPMTTYTCADIGAQTVVLTADDGNGNTYTANCSVTVTETTLPTITCPAAVTMSTDAGTCDAAIDVLLATATDNCGANAELGNGLDFDGSNDHVTVPNDAAFDFPSGAFTYEAWAKSETSGNWAKQSSLISQRGADHRGLDAWGGTSKMQFYAGIAISSPDIPDIEEWHHYAGTFDGTTMHLYIDGVLVASQVGGTIGASTQDVYIGFDNCCANDRYFTGNMDEIRIWNTARTQGEICLNMNNELTGSEAGLVAYYNFNQGVVNGNNSTETSLTDSGPNSFDGTLNNFTLNGSTSNWTNGTEPASLIDITNDFNGLCDASGTYSLGTTAVVWTATDASGNSHTCTQNITVEDNEDPVITCPTSVTANTDTNLCTASGVTVGTATATDNCTTITITNDAPSTYNLGATTVTWTANDGNGQSVICLQTVTIEDNEDSVITCPSSETISTDAGTCASVYSYAAVTATDNCSGNVATTLTSGLASGTSFPLGANDVTWTATDGANNSASCTFTITVEDNEDPVAICQNVTVVLDANGDGSTTAVAVNNNSTDNCGIQTMTLNQTTFSCDDLTNYSLSLDGIDDYVIPPEMPLGGVSSFTIETWMHPISTDPINEIFRQSIFIESDRRDIVFFYWADGSLSFDMWDDSQATGRTRMNATSGSINFNAWNHIAIVYDGTGATATDKVKLYLDGILQTTSIHNDGGTADFPPVSPEFYETPEVFLGGLPTLSRYTEGYFDEYRIWSTSRTQAQIQNNLYTEVAGQAGLLTYYRFDEGMGTTAVDQLGTYNGTLENGAGFTTERPFGSGSNSTEVVMTVTDAAGNVSNCISSVTLTDNIAPVAMCSDLTINLPDENTYNLSQAEIDGLGATTTDNCSTTTYSITSGQTAYDCSDVGSPITITLTATDEANNSNTCTSDITITDTNSVCCDIAITNVASTNEVCPGADDGTITVTATCTTCTSIEYAIAEINGGAYQSSNSFTGLPDGSYTVNVRDTGDNDCNDTGSGTVTAGTDATDPVAVCPTTAPVVSLDATGNGTLSAAAIDNGSTDDCSDIANLTFSLSQSSFTCADVISEDPNADWEYVGAGGFSIGSSERNSIAIHPVTGEPYVAYGDSGNAGKLSVKRYDGTNWVLVGAEGFSTANSVYTSIKFSPSNEPHVAYHDGSNNLTTVHKFDGTNWVTVGPAGFSGSATEQDLEFNPVTGEPYVAYKSGLQRTSVMKYDGTAWSYVGPTYITAGTSPDPSITFDSAGTPYVGFYEVDNGSKATVMQFDGTSWNYVGVGFSDGSATFVNIEFDDSDNLFAAFRDDANSKTTVKQYDGTNWNTLGDVGAGTDGTYTNIAFSPLGELHVNYGPASVKKWDGTQWTAVGSLAFGSGSNYLQLVFSPVTGEPYVSYQDPSNGSGASVQKYPVGGVPTITILTVTDEAGNTSTCEATVTVEGPAITVTATLTEPCVGESTGAIDLSPTGGIGTYTYAWDNAASTEDLTGLAMGTYAVTVYDQCGSTAEYSYTLGELATPDLAAIATQSNTCPDLDLELTNLTITDNNSVAGTTTTFHSVMPTSATDMTNQLGSTLITADQTVFVMVASAAGCFDVETIVVDIVLCCDISISNVTIMDEQCPGDNDGSIAVTAVCATCTNGNTDIEYSIDGTNWQASNVFAGLAPNTFDISVRDMNDLACTSFEVNNVVNASSNDLAISGSETDASCPSGTDGSVDLTITGGEAGNVIAYSEDFEDGMLGDFTSLGVSGVTLQTTTVNPPENGGTTAMELIGGTNSHTISVEANLTTTNPNNISYYIKTSTIGFSGYLKFLDSSGGDVFNTQFNSGGNYTVGGDIAIPGYAADQWYFIEFRNMDWTNNSYDIYVDGNLVLANDYLNGNDISKITSYNFSSSASTFYDEIEFTQPGSVSYMVNWEDASNSGTSISTNEDISNVSPGTYNVTVTDGFCSEEGSFTVAGTPDTEVPVIVSCPMDVTVSNTTGICEATNVMLVPPTATDNCEITSIVSEGGLAADLFFVGERGGAGAISSMDESGTRNQLTTLDKGNGVVMLNSTTAIVTRWSATGDNVFYLDLNSGVTTPIAALTDGIAHGLELDGEGNVLVVTELYTGAGSGTTGKIKKINLTTNAVSDFVTGLNRPADILKISATEYLISEFNLNMIVKYDSSTDIVTDFSIPGSGMTSPTDIFLEADGNLLVAENGGDVSRIDAVTGVRTVLASPGGVPHGIATDFEGDIYVTRWGAGDIIKLDVDNNFMQSTFSTGYATPVYMARRPSNLFAMGTTSPVTWTVTDASGNTATCIQNVTVEDGEDPVISCSDLTINLVDLNDYTMSQADIDMIGMGTVDNCTTPILSISAGTTTYGCADIGNSFAVTLLATDANGNTSTCPSNVTIADPNNVCCNIDIAAISPLSNVCNSPTVNLYSASVVDNNGTSGTSKTFHSAVPTSATDMSNQLASVYVESSQTVYVMLATTSGCYDVESVVVTIVDCCSIYFEGDGFITTLAGTGVPTYIGDGGNFAQATYNSPQDMIMDVAGNKYILDSGNHAVRKIDATTGVISTIAGTGVAGYSGDGGLATSAELNFPRVLAFDPSGDLLIADANNSRIRKVDLSTGVITTIVGSGNAGNSGDGGPATAADIFFPAGMDYNSLGELIFTDSNNSVVRKVDAAGIISTIVGAGEFSLPQQLTIDDNDDVFVIDFGNKRIKKLDAGTFAVSIFAGDGTGGFEGGYSGDGGLATAAALNVGQGCRMLIAADGNVTFPDIYNNVIRQIDGSTGIINTIVGAGTIGYTGDGGDALAAELSSPASIAWDTDGQLLIVDSGNNVIRKIISSDAFVITDASCDTATDGSITVNAICSTCDNGNADIEYSVDGTSFQSSNVFTGLVADDYTVTIRDAMDITCSTTMVATVGDGGVACCDISISAVVATDEQCPGDADGTITVTAACASCTNGSADIEYSVDGTNFQTSSVFSGLAPNSYTVTVREINNTTCSATDSGTVAAGADTTDPTLVGCPSAMTLTLNVCNEFTLTAADLGITATDDCTADPVITFSQTVFTSAGLTAVVVTATDAATTPNTSTCSVAVTMEANPALYTVTAGADTDMTCVETAITITEADLISNDNASNNATLEIQELSLTNASDGALVDNNDGTWTFTPAAGFTGDVDFTYVVKSSDASLFFGGTSHYYEYVSALDITWTAAKAAAEASTLNGLPGYLATITTQAENEFIATQLEGNGWMGASDAAVEGEWRWVTGPEASMESGAGLLFWSGATNGSAQNGQYNNWWILNGNQNEPNNSGGDEDYGHLITGFAPLGTWNDWPNDLNSPTDDVQGYVVEYGGLGGCAPDFTATGTLTVSVNVTPDIASIGTQMNTCPGVTVELTNVTVADNNNVSGTTTTFHSSLPTSATDMSNQLGSTEITADQTVYAMVANATTGCYDTESIVVDIMDCSGPPVAVCTPYTADVNSNCEAFISAEDIDGGSFDPFNEPISLSIANAGPYALGTHDVELSVTDGASTSTCIAVVTVEDNTGPIFLDVQEIVLLEEDYENPSSTPSPSGCWQDLELHPQINHFYGQSGFTYQQRYTVETMLINGSSNIYTDPSGEGGDYCIGLFSSAQEDRLALTFDTQGQQYLNVSMDLSAIDITSCASFGGEVPVLVLNLYNSPNGSFNINSPGTLLDQATVEGIEIGANSFTFNWKRVMAGLDASGSTDGHVSLEWDLVAGGYAGFDNLKITASNNSVTDFPPQSVTIACLSDLQAAPTVGAIDNCGGTPTVTYDESSIDNNINDQVITRTWTATDAAGNTSIEVQTITVDDTEAPAITACAMDVVVDADPGAVCEATGVALGTPVATDNCSSTINLTNDAVAAFPEGTSLVTWTADDGNGNSSTCIQNVIVTTCNTGNTDAFITTWDITATNLSITIPTQSGYSYDYTVDWGDGTVQNFTGPASHMYTSTGIKTVQITGRYPGIRMRNASSEDRTALQSVEQWGDIEWLTGQYSFTNCPELVINATDAPDLSKVQSLFSMFQNCPNLTGNFNNWNTSTIRDMNYVFGAAGGNIQIADWDVSNVESMVGIFSGNEFFNDDIGDWDVSKVTRMDLIFFRTKNFSQDLSSWNTANVVSLDQAFSYSNFNGDISTWDVSNVRSMVFIFQRTPFFNQDISNWNVSKVIRFVGAFDHATAFNQNLGNWDILGVNDFSSTYRRPRNHTRFLSFAGLDIDNYDATLIGWENLYNQPRARILRGVVHADGLEYCAGTQARLNLRRSRRIYTLSDRRFCPNPCNCDPTFSNLIPNTEGGMHTADIKCDDGQYTHYCDNQGRLLLSIDSYAAADIDPEDVNIKIVPGTRYYQQYCEDSGGTEDGNCFISQANGSVILCRTWDVDSEIEDAKIKYYWDDSDVALVNQGIREAGLTGFFRPQSMWFYKAKMTDGHTKPEDLALSDVDIVDYKGSYRPAGYTNYRYRSELNNSYSAEYLVSSFSGGGGGGAEMGGSPICGQMVATISGGETLSAPGTSTVSVSVEGGTAPYTVTLSNGVVVPNYSSGSAITVDIEESMTIMIDAVTDAEDCPQSSESGMAIFFINDGTDDEPPIASCKDISVSLDVDARVSIDSLAINDDSYDLQTSILAFELSQYNFECSDGSSVNVTMTVYDESGNSASCTGTVTILDPLNACCPTQRHVPFPPAGDKQYEADVLISSDGVVRQGDGSTNIKMKAGSTVELQPGFEVEKGALYEALIDPCGNN